MHVKGLEFPQYEPRGSWGMSLAYAVADRGACHMRAYAANEEVFAAAVPPYTAEGKGEIVFNLGQWNAVKFSMCVCDFWATLSMETMAEIMTLVTGKEWTVDRIAETGTRVLNIARAFNQREGFSAKDDKVPRRLFDEALENGPAAGQKIPEEAFEDMKQQYYAVMGWDSEGRLPQSLIDTL